MSPGGHEKYFHGNVETPFCCNRTCKILKIVQQIRILCTKSSLNRNFALGREIIHDNEFSLNAVIFIRKCWFDLK